MIARGHVRVGTVVLDDTAAPFQRLPYSQHRPEPLWWAPIPRTQERLADPEEAADAMWASAAMVGVRAARHVLPRYQWRLLSEELLERLTVEVTDIVARARGLGWFPGTGRVFVGFYKEAGLPLVITTSGMDSELAAFRHGWSVGVTMVWR